MAPAALVAWIVVAFAAVLCGLAIARLRSGHNALALRHAKYAGGASMAFLPITLSAALAQSMVSNGPESKAYYLARGISATLNAGSLIVPIGVASIIVWIVARRREARTKA